MRSTKTFDCVEMKDRIHRQIAQECAGLPDEQVLARIREALSHSQDAVARRWREIATPNPPGGKHG